jgi:hypothetical protein
MTFDPEDVPLHHHSSTARLHGITSWEMVHFNLNTSEVLFTLNSVFVIQCSPLGKNKFSIFVISSFLADNRESFMVPWRSMAPALEM